MNSGTVTYEKVYSADSILCSALDIAEQMLKCGAEINRVEDTIYRICSSYGAENIEVFTIPSLITAEISFSSGDHSAMVRRIYSSENNLARLELLNDLSRKLCQNPIDPIEVKAKIEQTRLPQTYPIWIRYIGAMVATSAFTIFFGGSFIDMIPTAIIALILTFYDFHQIKKFNKLLNTLVPAFIGGTLSILFVWIGIGQNVDKIMIGTIMLLIPGLALGNSIRDMLCGDIISGAVRFIHSILLASAIALGYFTAITIFGGIIL